MNLKCYSKKPFFLLFLVVGLFYFDTIAAATPKQCDSLIDAGFDAMAKKNYVRSLELLTEARIMAEKNQWYKQMFNAIHTTGGNYYMMLDYGEALNQYLKSYEIALKHLGAYEETVVLNNISLLYIKEKKFAQAQTYLEKALKLAQQRKDSSKIGYFCLNLASVAIEVRDFKKAADYLQRARAYLKSPEEIVLLQMVVIDNELQIGNSVKARAMATELLPKMKNEQNLDNTIHLYVVIIKSYLKENNPDQALLYMGKALAAKPDEATRMDLFGLLSDIYFKKGLYKQALNYKDSVAAVESRLDEIKNIQLFKTSEVKFRIQDYKREIASKDASIRNERRFFYTILAVIVIGIFFLLLTFRNMKIKNRQNKLIAERNREIIEFKLQKEIDDNLLLKRKEEIAVLEQQRLIKEIELNNQKISAKALYSSGRNQLLQDIVASLSAVPELSKNKTLINHVRALKNHLKVDSDWDDFILHFESVNQGFLKKLKEKHPGLTANDIRYISYVYMNLSTKEIATMLNITLEACRKRKERIVNRLGLSEDISLIDYLSSI